MTSVNLKHMRMRYFIVLMFASGCMAQSKARSKKEASTATCGEFHNCHPIKQFCNVGKCEDCDSVCPDNVGSVACETYCPNFTPITESSTTAEPVGISVLAKTVVAVVATVVGGGLLLLAVICIIRRRPCKQRQHQKTVIGASDKNNEPLLKDVCVATDANHTKPTQGICANQKEPRRRPGANHTEPKRGPDANQREPKRGPGANQRKLKRGPGANHTEPKRGPGANHTEPKRGPGANQRELKRGPDANQREPKRGPGANQREPKRGPGDNHTEPKRGPGANHTEPKRGPDANQREPRRNPGAVGPKQELYAAHCQVHTTMMDETSSSLLSQQNVHPGNRPHTSVSCSSGPDDTIAEVHTTATTSRSVTKESQAPGESSTKTAKELATIRQNIDTDVDRLPIPETFEYEGVSFGR